MDNQTPTPIQEPVSQPTSEAAQSAYLQAQVVFVHGLAAIGDHTGLLEWGADQRIRLIETDTTANQAKGVVFDVALADIKKVGGLGSSLIFHLKSDKYTITFSHLGTVASTILFAGPSITDTINKEVGLTQWVEAFQSHNVPVTFKTGANFNRIGNIIAGTILAVGLLVVAIEWLVGK